MATQASVPFTSKQGMRFVVRSAQPEDAGGVLRLGQAVIGEMEFQVTEPDEFKMTLEQEREWLAQMEKNPDELALVAETQGQIIGFIDFHRKAKRRRLAHTGEFGMSVKKDFRNQGIGSALLTVLLQWARKHPQIEKVSLVVFANNDNAIAAYKKLGFQEDGRRTKEVKLADGRYLDDILMFQWVK